MKTVLKLFIAGNSVSSRMAVRNFEKLFGGDLRDQVDAEIIDVRKNLRVAIEYNLRAIPMLLRCGPLPVTRIIGDLSDLDRVRSLLALESPLLEETLRKGGVDT